MRQAIAAIGLAMAFAGPALAQDYPNKPIKFFVGFPPGGSTDIVSRVLGQKLTERLGQQVVVEQKVGGVGLIANDFVAKSPPDGYNMVLLTGGHPGTAAIMKKLPYDPVKDFAMVSTVIAYPMVISVAQDSPMTEVMGGRVDVLIETATFAFGQIRGGKLRGLALSSASRYPLMPELPTVAETLPGVEFSSWLGVAVSPGTPRPTVDRLNRELRTILDTADMRQRFAEFGGVPTPSSPEEMQARIAREIARWTRVVDVKKIERQ